MKRKIRIVFVIMLLLILFLPLGYFGLTSYYSRNFSLHTWINGVYCTGKTVEEANSELLSQIEAPIVIITDGEGREYELDFSEMDYRADFTLGLYHYQQNQNPFVWLKNWGEPNEGTIQPITDYNETMLREAFMELPFVEEELESPKLCYVQRFDWQGYQLVDTLNSRLDIDKSFAKLVELIQAGHTYILQEEFLCYMDVEPTREQKEYRKLWSILEEYYNCDIVYDMGAEQIALTPDILSDFLVTKDSIPVFDVTGSLILDRQKVEAFVYDLVEDYDTYEKERQFQSTRGDLITITEGNYGTKLNAEAEITFLMENLLADDMHTGIFRPHMPVYEKEAFVRGKNDIGDTYIEIDMTDQKLYYYADGEIAVETDIVTGNMKKNMDTPEGIYSVYQKQTDRTLRGPGYASHVDYWMPVNGNIGIHDADWRKKFGGTIYKTNGSHGCINVPVDVMPDLYEMVEVGTPVIMFY